MLILDSYTFDPDKEFVSDVKSPTDYEASGTGYTGGFSGSGRIAVPSLAVTINNTNDRAEFTFGQLDYGNVNIGNVLGIILWRPNSTDANSKMLFWLQFTSMIPTNGGSLKYNPPSPAQVYLT